MLKCIKVYVRTFEIVISEGDNPKLPVQGRKERDRKREEGEERGERRGRNGNENEKCI